MKDVIVTMAVSCVRGMMPEYIRRLSAAGITVNVDDIAEVLQFEASGRPTFSIGVKIATLRYVAARFSDYDFIIPSDGWDVNFYGDKKSLLERIPREGVLWAAEKNCWPNDKLAERIPDKGPWRFVNGGLLAGTPKSFMEMCDRIESHPLYRPEIIDQEFMNLLLAEKSDIVSIDSETNLFFCLHSGFEELGFHEGQPFNSFHATWPLFIHANGNWSPRAMFRKYEASLKVKEVELAI